MNPLDIETQICAPKPTRFFGFCLKRYLCTLPGRFVPKLDFVHCAIIVEIGKKVFAAQTHIDIQTDILVLLFHQRLDLFKKNLNRTSYSLEKHCNQSLLILFFESEN